MGKGVVFVEKVQQKTETIKKINKLLKKFNDTFDLEANIMKDDDEFVASGLKIKNLKNNGTEFIGEMYDIFSTIIETLSDEHELIYDEFKGIVIAKKVVKQVVQTDYVIEDFDNE
jgi:hypothetical protein